MCRRDVRLLLGVLSLSAAGAAAQEPPPGPPPVLVISREEIKPGSMGAHEKQVGSYMALFNRANVGGYRIGLAPISGDDNQVLYLEGYASFAELEATRKKSDETFSASPALQAELDGLEARTGPMHSSQKTALAVFREDLSYRPLKMDEVAKARYFNVTVTHAKVGRGVDYTAYTKQFNAAREKAKLDEHSAVYQVLSGAPPGTFVTFTVNRSLTEWDTFTKNIQARNKTIDEALGGDVVAAQRRDMAEQIIAESKSSLYAVNPKISRPSPQFAGYDPGFWSPKPAAAKETKK